MIIYALMKFTEYIPSMYDVVMDLITLGNHSRAHKAIVSEVKPPTRVLDIGCGTGDIAIRCAEAGAEVCAIDASPQMLRIFRKKLERSAVRERITILESGAGSIGTVLKNERFNVIVMSLVLGELPVLIRRQTLKAASELLEDGGVIVISDELWPSNPILSALYYLLFALFFVPNFLLTRTMIRPVKDLKQDIQRFNLRIIRKTALFFGVISIWKVTKTDGCQTPSAA